MRVEDILREIDAALERQGISARAASIRAQGAPEMIRDMRRGHVPSVERLRSLCDVLGLEFYVGPPRWRRPEDGGALPDVPLRALERAAQDMVRLTLDAGGNPIPEDLGDMLRDRWMEDQIAVPRVPPAGEARTFGFIDDVDALRKASRGHVSDKPVAEQELPPAFRGLDPVSRGEFLVGQFISEENAEDRGESAGDRARSSGRSEEDRGTDRPRWDIVEIPDASMEPTLPSGAVTMVDSASRDWDPRGIKVVQVGGNMVFRRVVTDAEGRRLMACDHPDWPDEPWPADARIVGQARWVGHRLR